MMLQRSCGHCSKISSSGIYTRTSCSYCRIHSLCSQHQHVICCRHYVSWIFIRPSSTDPQDAHSGFQPWHLSVVELLLLALLCPNSYAFCVLKKAEKKSDRPTCLFGHIPRIGTDLQICQQQTSKTRGLGRLWSLALDLPASWQPSRTHLDTKSEYGLIMIDPPSTCGANQFYS